MSACCNAGWDEDGCRCYACGEWSAGIPETEEEYQELKEAVVDVSEVE